MHPDQFFYIHSLINHLPNHLYPVYVRFLISRYCMPIIACHLMDDKLRLSEHYVIFLSTKSSSIAADRGTVQLGTPSSRQASSTKCQEKVLLWVVYIYVLYLLC
ncbi:hypothetical protein NP493_574g00054 [Ridgeia piscesae]|uniref:Uncharacterized protein n=1 Tax=Ridgeia piscesae TaxID=27915 RepID=A0AAD9NPR5_RIDPI|nr:hypothetical protein NP493_574g00054 [Ridgeia piscesae]